MKQIITDEQFEVVVSLRFAPSYKREFIRQLIDSFIRHSSFKAVTVEEVADS
jgi:hypothetical protein